MFSVALKNLLSEKIRFAVSVLGVAFSVFLIGLFLSLFRGFDSHVDDYIQSVPADLWVMQSGSRDLLSASVLPRTLPDQIKSQDGGAIDQISSIMTRPIDIVAKGEPIRTQIIGYDTKTGIGGPTVIEGATTPGKGEIIIDKILAKLADIGVGDTVELGGLPFKVVGKSEASNLVFTQLSFLNLDDARLVLGTPDIVSFVVLTAKDKSALPDITKKLQDASPLIQVYSRETFIENTRNELTKVLVPLLIVVVLVGFVVGTTVVGLTIYTLTVERMKEYGIMKALGFNNSDLFKVVIQQSITAGIIGYGVGLIFILGAKRLLAEVLPQFTTELTTIDLVGVFIATIVMAVIAAWVPIRRLARLDPVIAFNP